MTIPEAQVQVLRFILRTDIKGAYVNYETGIVQPTQNRWLFEEDVAPIEQFSNHFMDDLRRLAAIVA